MQFSFSYTMPNVDPAQCICKNQLKTIKIHNSKHEQSKVLKIIWALAEQSYPKNVSRSKIIPEKFLYNTLQYKYHV